MEDAHTCLLELPGDPKAAYFSVFDGHGGTRVAKHAGLHLHERLVSQPEYARTNIKEGIRRAFLSLDAEMQAEMTHSLNAKLHEAEVGHSVRSGVPPLSKPHGSPPKIATSGSHRDKSPKASTLTVNPSDELAGSTGIVVLLRDQMLYCANAGDSRAVCSRLGVAYPLSVDHKPSLRGEKERILAAGGWVDANRVNGNLALSRGFGDFIFKRSPRQNAENQIVSANPDIYARRLSPEVDEFIVICCDGIWDVMTNQEVVGFIRPRLSHGVSPAKVCEELMMRCLAPDCHANGLGCDNMTIVLVCLLFGQPMSHLQRRCARACLAGPAADILVESPAITSLPN